MNMRDYIPLAKKLSEAIRKRYIDNTAYWTSLHLGTAEAICEAEEAIGYRLPESFRAFEFFFAGPLDFMGDMYDSIAVDKDKQFWPFDDVSPWSIYGFPTLPGRPYTEEEKEDFVWEIVGEAEDYTWEGYGIINPDAPVESIMEVNPYHWDFTSCENGERTLNGPDRRYPRDKNSKEEVLFIASDGGESRLALDITNMREDNECDVYLCYSGTFVKIADSFLDFMQKSCENPNYSDDIYNKAVRKMLDDERRASRY